MNLSELMSEQGIVCKTEPEFIPDVQPVSIIDVDRMPPMEMSQPMSDPCPQCGGFCMQVGDYVCWGVCYKCYDDTMKIGETE